MYDFIIMHRDGKQHANADALSRRPSIETETKAIQCVLTCPIIRETVTSTGEKDENAQTVLNTCPSLSIDLEEIRKQQQSDNSLLTVLSWKQTGKR